MELGKQHQHGPQNSYPISARGLEGFNSCPQWGILPPAADNADNPICCAPGRRHGAGPASTRNFTRNSTRAGPKKWDMPVSSSELHAGKSEKMGGACFQFRGTSKTVAPLKFSSITFQHRRLRYLARHIPAAPPAWHRSLPAARHRSLQPAKPAPPEVGIPTSRFSDFGILPEKPSPGQRRRSGSDASLPESHSILARAQDSPLNGLPRCLPENAGSARCTALRSQTRRPDCPKNPSPGQRRRSVIAVLAASLTECFFSPFTRPAVNPGAGTGLLTQSWRGHRIAPLNPGVPGVSQKTLSARRYTAMRSPPGLPGKLWKRTAV